MSNSESTSEKKIEEYQTLQQIVDQLKWCGYESEAGLLEKNVAFIALERMAAKEGDADAG